jgi:leader peptidase (prepilin peptidase)/N-methyltransferase
MSQSLVLLAAAFGAAAAAFVPRIAVRLALPSRPSCATCSRPFPPGFPGWVRAGPACPCTPGAWRAVAGSAVAAGLPAATAGAVPWLPVLLVAVILGTLLVAVDLRCLRLPDPVVALLAVVLLVPLTVLGPDRLIPALMGAGVSGVAYLALAIASRGGLGLGDVKLATVLGFGLGFLGGPALLAGLVLPHLINGPIVLFLLVSGRARRRTPLPFGPALLVGALVAVATTT